MPNFVGGLNNPSKVVSSSTAICIRWLTRWKNRLFHAKNSVFFLPSESQPIVKSCLYWGKWGKKTLLFCMKKTIFSKSRPPTANRYWGWNNLTKVVQFTGKVWHLHSSILKKSNFSIKNEFGLIYCYFWAFNVMSVFDQFRNFGVFLMSIHEISGQIIIGGL